MNLTKTHSGGRGRSVAGEVPGARGQVSGFTSRPTAGFTLIELLVVIAVIAILAALIFPVTGAVNRAKIRSKARAELGQVQSVIDNYKAKLGVYPPDNPGSPATNQLYFELLGTTNIGTAAVPIYQTLDGSARIRASSLGTFFGVDGSGNPKVAGFVNCTPAGGGDEGRFATPFLSGLTPGRIASLTNAAPELIKFLVCSVPTPNTGVSSYLGSTTLTPFYYNSSNPTNNPGTYDLWVDVVVAGKINRICNWTKEVLYP